MCLPGSRGQRPLVPADLERNNRLNYARAFVTHNVGTDRTSGCVRKANRARPLFAARPNYPSVRGAKANELEISRKWAISEPIMTLAMQTALLTTVNAPYQIHLNAGGLADALSKSEIGVGQVASFFTEASVDEQTAFAEEFGISNDVLTQVAHAFVNWSGQSANLIA